jgi:hypothetical protein
MSKGRAGANVLMLKVNIGEPTNILKNYTIKKVSGFPVRSWDVTYQTLLGWELLNNSRQGRVL